MTHPNHRYTAHYGESWQDIAKRVARVKEGKNVGTAGFSLEDVTSSPEEAEALAKEAKDYVAKKNAG